MGATEVACICTSLVIYAVVFLLFAADAKLRGRVVCGNGEFYWYTLRVAHLSQDGSGAGTAKLAFMRLAFGGFAAGTSVYQSLIEPSWLTTFTAMSWCLLGAYFLIMACISLAAATGCGRPQDSSAGLLGCIMWVLFQLLTAVSIFICLVVWLLLIPQSITTEGWPETQRSFFDWISLSAHNGSVFFMLLEGSCNRLQYVPAHALFAILYANSYVVFSWFWFLRSRFFWYFFLDWEDPSTPIFYIVLSLVLFGFGLLVARCGPAVVKQGMEPDSLPGRSSARLPAPLEVVELRGDRA